LIREIIEAQPNKQPRCTLGKGFAFKGATLPAPLTIWNARPKLEPQSAEVITNWARPTLPLDVRPKEKPDRYLQTTSESKSDNQE